MYKDPEVLFGIDKTQNVLTKCSKKKKKKIFKAIHYTEIIGTAQLYASFTF